MLEIPFGKLATRNIRLRLFCNTVEETILGPKKDKFATNQAAVAKALTRLIPHEDGRRFDARTWQNWFQGDLKKITIRANEIARLTNTESALYFLNIDKNHTSILAHLQAIDILIYALDKGPHSIQAEKKVAAAIRLISKIHEKWKPNGFGVLSIPCHELLNDDMARPYQKWSDMELFLNGIKSKDGQRVAKLPDEVGRLYQIGSPYNLLQYLERLFLEINPIDYTFGNTWTLDCSTCVLLFYCLWIWDSSEHLSDPLAKNIMEGLDAGLSLFFSPPREISKARYLLGVGHPWGKFNAFPDPRVERNILEVRRIYNRQLLKNGIKISEVRDIINVVRERAFTYR